jgi:hypothetical protein
MHSTRGQILQKNTAFTPSPSPSSGNWLRHQEYNGYPPSLSRFTPPPPSGASLEAAPTRTAIPENLTIRFGAHRASVYGSYVAAKTAPFAVAAKESVREAHARDFIQKPVQPKILDEEFSDYRKLLDDMATYPTLSPCPTS